MLGGADNPNGELPSYITGADRAGLCHFCQPQINTVSQNCGQQQPSVFWPDVIIFEMREVTCKTSPTVNFFQYFCNFRMGEHVINQTGKGRNTGRNEVA